MLVVELFLISGRAVPRDQLAPNVRKEADIVIWGCKTRIDAGGGMKKAAVVDQRDLLLLLASFGIPPKFGDHNVVSLILECTGRRKKSHLFRQSPILVSKVTEIVHGMVKRAAYLSVAELVVAMRLEEKFPLLPMLSSYLDVIKRKGTDNVNQGHVSAISMRKAFEKQLSRLQPIAKFLNKHNLCTKYASLDVDASISKLEKDMSNLDKEIESLNDQGIQLKPHQIPNVALERTETFEKPPQNQNARRSAEETASLKGIEAHLKPQALNARRRPGDSAPLERTETGAGLQNLNGKTKAEETAPSERIEYRLGSPSQPNDASVNFVSLNSWGSVSSWRPSSEHLYYMPGQMNMQTSSVPLSTVSARVVHPVLDRRFPSSLHDFPVLPAGQGPSGFLENGEGSYVPPSRHHGSEMYDRFRDSASATISSASDAFGPSQPRIAGTRNYLEARPEVQHVSAWQTTTHEPHPHGAGSRAPLSTNPYNFADMV